MRLLLDTHAFIWWLAGDDRLSLKAKTAMEDGANEIFVSAASVWEITTKYRLGKLTGVAAIAADLETAITGQGFVELAISVRHGQLAGALPGPHRDPFDRMLMAQTILDKFVLVSNESTFDTYGVARLW